MGMTDKRRVLGRGLGALIPTHFAEPERRPSDIFFPQPVEPAGDVSRETGMPDVGLAENRSSQSDRPAQATDVFEPPAAGDADGGDGADTG